MSDNQSKGFITTIARKAEEKTKQLMNNRKQSIQNTQQQAYLQQQMYAQQQQQLLQYNTQGMVRPMMTPMGMTPVNMTYAPMGQQPQPGIQIQSMTGQPMGVNMAAVRPTTMHSGTAVQSMTGRPTQAVSQMGQQSRSLGAPPAVIPLMRPNNALAMPVGPGGNNAMTGRLQRPTIRTQTSSNAAPVSGRLTVDQIGQMAKSVMNGGNQGISTDPASQQNADQPQEATGATEVEASGNVQPQMEANQLLMVENSLAGQGPIDGHVQTNMVVESMQMQAADPSYFVQQQAGLDAQTNMTVNMMQGYTTDPSYFVQQPAGMHAQTNMFVDAMQGYTVDPSVFTQQATGLDAQTNMMAGMEMQQNGFQGDFGFPQMPMEMQPSLIGTDMMQQEAMQMQFQMQDAFAGGMMPQEGFGQMMDPGVFDMGGGFDMSASGYEG